MIAAALSIRLLKKILFVLFILSFVREVGAAEVDSRLFANMELYARDPG
jgi:hypothetical protein